MSAALRDLREGCVAEAFAIVGEGGVESLSLREVARRLRVSHQAPYKHFASRGHILAEIVRRAFDHFAEALDACPHSDDPGRDSFRMGGAYLEYARAHPLHYRLMFGSPLPDPAQHPEMMRSARHAFSLLRKGLERLFRAREVPPGALDLDLESIFIWSSLHGLASLAETDALKTLDLTPETRAALGAHALLRLGSALGLAPPALMSPQPNEEPK
jgi:AcrR family transcriptional regulator